MFTVPETVPTNVLANVTNQLADAGTLAIIAIVVAIPLLFYVVRQVIGLFPKSRGK